MARKSVWKAPTLQNFSESVSGFGFSLQELKVCLELGFSLQELEICLDFGISPREGL